MVLAFLLTLLGVIFALLGVAAVARGIKGSRMCMLTDAATWRRKGLRGSVSSLILGGTALVLVGILRMVSLSPSTTLGVWIRCAIILALAALAWHMLRTSCMTCTLSGVGLACLAVSVCASEQLVAMVLVAGPTLGLSLSQCMLLRFGSTRSGPSWGRTVAGRCPFWRRNLDVDA